MEKEERTLAARIDQPKLLSLLQRMIQYRSYSGEESELADFLAEFMQHLGLDVKQQEVEPGRANVIGILRGTGSGASLLYNGHIDTNPVGLGWTVDPLAGVVKDGCIYGIGVSNMKASDAAFLAAVGAIVEKGASLRGDVIVSLVVGELQGGIGTVKMLSEGLRADWFINGEPTDLSLLTTHAGTLELQIDVYGISRHMSRAEEGVNAIDQAMKVIAGLQQLRFKSADDLAAAGLNRMNIGAIKGGLGQDYIDWRIPQLPDLCTLKVALRYAHSQTRESVIADIQAMLDGLEAQDPRLTARIELSPKLAMPPFFVSVDEPIVQAVRRAHVVELGQEPRVGAIAPYKFYGTDAAHLAAAGIKGVVYGCEGKYNTMPDERVELVELYAAAQVYADTIMKICNEPADYRH